MVISKSCNIRTEDVTDENNENNQNNESNESDKDKNSKDSNSYTCNTMLKQISKKVQLSDDESKNKKHSTIKTRKRKCKLTSYNIHTHYFFVNWFRIKIKIFETKILHLLFQYITKKIMKMKAKQTMNVI